MRRSPKPALASILFLVFFNASLLLAQTATSTPASSSQAAAPAAAEGNVMIEELKSPNAGTRAKAARELGKAQDVSGLPALAEAVSDPSDKVRREVVLALAQMHQPEVLDALIKATRDNNEEISVLAVQSLVGYYTGNVPSPGFSGFLKKNWQRAKEHFNPDTTRIDPGVYVDPKVVAALDAALKSTRSIRASCVAAKGLGGRSGGGGKLGERHPQADIHSFANRTPWRFPTGRSRICTWIAGSLPSGGEGTKMQISAILKSKGPSVATIGRNATVAAAVAELARHNVGALVVSSDGRTVDGIVSERDVTRALDSFGGALLDRPIRLIMSSEVRTASPDENIESLAVMMTEYRIRHVPVLEDGVLAGIVSIGDVVKSRIEELEEDRDALLQYIQAR